MKSIWVASLVPIVLIGCSSKPVDLTPGTAHEGVEFKLVPLKTTYKQGEPITIRFQVKNTTKKEIPLLVDWRDPNFGMSISRSLKSGTTEYELPPLDRTVSQENAIFLTNISFMPLPPGVEGIVHAESIRNAKPLGGKDGPLPPGSYTFTAEYQVKTAYDGTYELGGKREKLPMDAGEAHLYLSKAPRGLWRSECNFVVTDEKIPPRTRRGGKPMSS